jgi:hypothetical protein
MKYVGVGEKFSKFGEIGNANTILTETEAVWKIWRTLRLENDLKIDVKEIMRGTYWIQWPRDVI